MIVSVIVSVVMMVMVVMVMVMAMIVLVIMPVIVRVAVDGGVVMVGIPGGVFPFSDGQLDSENRFDVAASVVAVRDDQPERTPFGGGERAAVALVDQDAVLKRVTKGDAGGKFSIFGMERHMVGFGEGI